MKQISLTTTGFELVTKRTRKRVFLDEMNLVVPWTELVGLIQLFAPNGAGAKGGRPAFAVETMLRIHFLQQWFGLSDAAMEESLHDTPLYCEFARLDPGATLLPDESTILRFRHLLEANNLSLQIMAAINATLSKRGLLLKTGTVVDATLIAAPSSTKNSTGERDPEMHQTKKGNQWHFGMKAHIGVDADSGLAHTIIGTAANVNDVTQGHGLQHGQESIVFADAGYQGVAKRAEATGVHWHVAMRPGKRRALDKDSPWGNLLDQAEQLKASVSLSGLARSANVRTLGCRRSGCSAVQGTAEQIEKAFTAAFMVLQRRISLFLNLPLDKLEKLSLLNELQRIGRVQAK